MADDRRLSLQISPDTWDQWVKDGTLPPACTAFPASTPRRRWKDVDRKLSGRTVVGLDADLEGAANFGKKPGSRHDAA